MLTSDIRRAVTCAGYFFKGRKMRFNRSGFTMVELVAVLIIVGILSALAINYYGGIYEQGLAREAAAQMRLIQRAEEMICEATACAGAYSACADTIACNNLLGLVVPAKNWQYSVNGAGTVSAQRTFGPHNACIYQLTMGSDSITDNGSCALVF